MIYIDTSVVLAALLAEDRRPPAEFWTGPLVSSRLLEYETWVRLHAVRAPAAVQEAAGFVVGSADLVEMTPLVLARALDPFPTSLRTLDALHVATASYLRSQGVRLRFATYDTRQAAAARAEGLDAFEP